MSSMKKRIICIDESGDDCELFNIVLSQAGYEVRSARSFTESLQFIEDSQFNLCIADISLFRHTGFELLEKVREIYPAIPLVICSPDARDSTREKAIQAGAQVFFTKPINFDSLIETIAQLIK